MKPTIQSEAAECGLASLAMIADDHGLHISLPELRRRFPLSLKGAKLSQLIFIAQQIGFTCRPLRLDMNDIAKLKLPCLLHWDMNHFVVLKRVEKATTIIFDPAIGKRRIPLDDVSDHFTGVALELSPSTTFATSAPAPSISAKQLTGRINGLWAALSQLLLLSLALQAFAVLAPFLMQWVVDQVLVSADRNLLTVLGLGFGVALLLQVSISQLRGRVLIYLSSQLSVQWTGNIFSHLLKLPLDFFAKRNLGDITSRLSSVQTIEKTLTTSFAEAIIDGLMAVVTLSLMLAYSWKMALVTLLTVALYAAIRIAAWQPLRDAAEQQLLSSARQETHLLETLRGMQSLKISGKESSRRSTYENLIVRTVNSNVRLAGLSLGFSSVSQLLFGLERVAVIWIGATLALNNALSVGMLIAYLAYKDQFAARTSGLIDKLSEFRMLRLHGERLADVALTAPDEEDVTTEAPAQQNLCIEVVDVWFRYGDGEPWVLTGCSFNVQAGDSIAIVGGSGCGKTTLMKLMLGLLQPTRGEIRIDGQELRKFGARRFRTAVGAVMQDDQLFAGSIADNICFFDPDFDTVRIEAAARLAAVHEDIAAMTMGYHGLIGDMGSSLSGGQKQRIILARALYRQPQVLFLDEATSHLDLTRERMVNEAVQQLQLTKIIVAHRPETIASAKRVLTMEAGTIV